VRSTTVMRRRPLASLLSFSGIGSGSDTRVCLR
jgi:hypothetical protein